MNSPVWRSLHLFGRTGTQSSFLYSTYQMKSMSQLVRFFVVAIAISLSGCAATVNKASSTQSTLSAPSAATTKVALVISGNATIQASSDWQTFRAEWRTAFNSAATTAGLAFAYFESEPTDQPVGTTLVKVSVNEYRYLTPGARFGFGIMTGNAFIDADAEFIELPTKRLLGTRKYATSSSAWQGVFSAMTDKQVSALSTEMVQEIKPK
jgi:hypothetical protein